MKRHLDYHVAIKYLMDSGFELNKMIEIPSDALTKQFQYWIRDDGAEMYLLEVLYTDHAFMFKLI